MVRDPNTEVRHEVQVMLNSAEIARPSQVASTHSWGASENSDKHADLEHLNSPFDTALPQGLCHGANETISQSEIDIDNNSAFFIDTYSVIDGAVAP